MNWTNESGHPGKPHNAVNVIWVAFIGCSRGGVEAHFLVQALASFLHFMRQTGENESVMPGRVMIEDDWQEPS